MATGTSYLPAGTTFSNNNPTEYVPGNSQGGQDYVGRFLNSYSDLIASTGVANPQGYIANTSRLYVNFSGNAASTPASGIVVYIGSAVGNPVTPVTVDIFDTNGTAAMAGGTIRISGTGANIALQGTAPITTAYGRRTLYYLSGTTTETWQCI